MKKINHPTGDKNGYNLGHIGEHNLVIATLPPNVYGTRSATAIANGLQRNFPLVRVVLMVGVGGGTTSAERCASRRCGRWNSSCALRFRGKCTQITLSSLVISKCRTWLSSMGRIKSDLPLHIEDKIHPQASPELRGSRCFSSFWRGHRSLVQTRLLSYRSMRLSIRTTSPAGYDRTSIGAQATRSNQGSLWQYLMKIAVTWDLYTEKSEKKTLILLI